MAVKKKIAMYTSLEQEWLQKKFDQFQKALDNYDLENLVDRYGPKELPNGKVVEAIIETRTDQLKAVMYILEKLPKLVASLEELRTKASEKLEAMGNKKIAGIMEE